jgi:HlyD family secretion protein
LVASVSVKDGDRVAAGQELIRLDQKLAQSALEEAQANLRQMQLAQDAAKLDLDDEGLALKKATYDRDLALLKQGLIPQAQADASRTAYVQGQRALDRVKLNIEGNDARIAQAQASVNKAQTQLQQTVIRAPFDAVVLRRQVEFGSAVAGVSQSASGGTVLMTLGDARQSALFAKVTALDAKRLKTGMAARIRLDTDPAEVLTGVVQSISTAGDVDQTSRLTTFPVVVTVTANGGNWVNVPAQAEIVLRASVDALVVPDRCVRTDPAGRSYVLVQGASAPTRRDVELGTMEKGRTQIRSGVERGQTLVCR